MLDHARYCTGLEKKQVIAHVIVQYFTSVAPQKSLLESRVSADSTVTEKDSQYKASASISS